MGLGGFRHVRNDGHPPKTRINRSRFQAVCLDRSPLIRLRLPGVPLPLNCNDIDVTDTAVHPRPLSEPTEMSMNIFRAQIFQLLNQHLCSWDEPSLRTYDHVRQLDIDILRVMDGIPAYFQLDDNRNPPPVYAGYEFLTWQNHILRTCVSTQRIRMYRPFLSTRESEPWSRCAGAAEDALAVYRTLRKDPSPSSWQKFFAQAYQVFSVAVTVAALLLVEGDLPIPNANQQIHDMTSDLKMLDEQGCSVLIATQGRQVLLKMLSMCKDRVGSSPADAQRLVPDISIILGGEQAAKEYMDRLATQRNVIHPAPSPPVLQSQMREPGEAVDENLAGSAGLFMGSILDDVPDFDPETFPEDLTSGLLNWDMSGLLSSTLDI